MLHIAVAWLVTIYGYALVMFAKQRHDEAPMPLFWRLHLYPLAFVVAAFDFAFNWTAGWMFLEKPVPWLFSRTVEHHFLHSGGWRGQLASFWAGVLNWVDPRHIRS